jgi:hypothetical protein
MRGSAGELYPVPSLSPSPHLGSTAQFQAMAASMKLSVSPELLDLGQLVGLLGRVISSSQGLYLYTNTKKTHTQHKH